jgi:hypothetical protein
MENHPTSSKSGQALQRAAVKYLQDESSSWSGLSIFLVALILVGILIRIYNVFTASVIDLDGIQYVQVARDFMMGAFGKGLEGFRLPGYPTFIALFNLFVPDVELAGRIVSLVAGLLLIALCLHFLKDRKRGLWLAALVAIHPYLAQYSGRVLSESLATVLFVCSFFCFYEGLTTGNRMKVGAAGIFLTFAYLTRTEYIIYFVPLSLVIIFKPGDKKITMLLSFLGCFLPLAALFLIYLRLHSGVWIIDRKMLSWSPYSHGGTFDFLLRLLGDPLATVRNIPLVIFGFCEAVFLPFLALAVIGFRKSEHSFRLLAIVLTATHVLARSCISHYTKRYAVEFIPIMLVFAVDGLPAILAFIKGDSYKRHLTRAACIVSVGVSLATGIRMPNYDREMAKKAGLLVGSLETHAPIAARLPIASFYANVPWLELEGIIPRNQSCEGLHKNLSSMGAFYIVTDHRVESDHPAMRDCLSDNGLFLKVREFRQGKKSCSVYHLR